MDTGLRRLRYFNALAELLNFRRAAQKLNITQPALSRAIAQLEAEVGAALFERSNRRVRLTLAGRTFAIGCGQVLKSLDGTIDQTRKVAHGYVGNLKIGYTDTVIAGRLPDIVKAFRGIAPGIDIRLIQAYTELQMQMIADGILDIGIMTGPIASASLATLDIQSDRLVAILPRDHPLAKADEVALAELSDFAFILGDLDCWGAYHALLFRYFDRCGFRPQIVQTAPESRAIIGLVTCGLGVTIMPESLAIALDRRVVARPVSDIGEPMITQAGWMPDAANPAVKRFLGHLRDYEI